MDNEKIYTEGKVILSTKEYRDLIEDSISNQKDYQEARSKNWEFESKVDKLTDENKKLKTLVDGYQYYLKEKNLEQPYRMWILEQQAQEEEND